MNGDCAFSADFAARFSASDLSGSQGAQVVLFPPALQVAYLADHYRDSSIAIGVQNVNDEQSGAFTGEISAELAADAGAAYGLVGHSERRALFGEADAFVARKYEACLRAGLTPVLCVGETADERQAGNAQAVVERQLSAVVDAAGVGALAEGVVAYEPVWAIGTGATATPKQAQEIHAFVRSLVARSDQGVADDLRIVYGGSVKADNAAELFAEDDIDGGLVGGASLDPEAFAAICRAAN